MKRTSKTISIFLNRSNRFLQCASEIRRVTRRKAISVIKCKHDNDRDGQETFGGLNEIISSFLEVTEIYTSASKEKPDAINSKSVHFFF